MGNMGTTQQISITLQTDSTSPVIPIGGFSSGGITVATGITTLTYYNSDEAGPAADLTMYQSGDVSAQTVVANRPERIPSDVFVHPFLQIRANAAGVAKISLNY